MATIDLDAQTSPSGTTPDIPSKRCCQLAEDREARGFIYTSAARGPVVIFGALFASVAINSYAVSVSDCNGEILNGSLKASSVLSSLAVIEGVLNAILSPFIGAYADLTPHRKLGLFIGVATFTVLVIVQGIMFISSDSDKVNPNDTDTFLQKPLIQSDIALLALCATVVVQVVAYEVAALLTITYSAELSTDRKTTTGYISLAYTMLNGMQLLVALVIVAAGFVLGLNDFQQGTYGAVVVVVVTLAWFIPGFPKLGQRPVIDDDLKKGCCGLAHLVEAFKDIFRDYKELLKLLISWCLASASLSSITSLSTTYLQFHLGYEGLFVSALLALALLFSVPGSLVTKFLVSKFDVKPVYVATLVIFGLSFILAPFVLTAEDEPFSSDTNTTLTQFGLCDDPESVDEPETIRVAPGYMLYITAMFTALWGVGIGAVYVANNAFYATLVPGSRETSFFGIKVTFAKAFTWLPPLVFTTINEQTDLLQYAILVLAPFFLGGAAVAMLIDHDKGMADIEHTLHLRRGDKFGTGAQSEAQVVPGKVDTLEA